MERAGLLGGIRFRSLPTDEEYTLRGHTVEEAIKEDRDKGLIPFYVNHSTYLRVFTLQYKFKK